MTKPASDQLVDGIERNLDTWGDTNGVDIRCLIARIRQQDETIKRIMADREYVIGWNDGYGHAIDAAAASMRPMLRSMISRGEAHATILALKDPNRAALKGGEA